MASSRFGVLIAFLTYDIYYKSMMGLSIKSHTQGTNEKAMHKKCQIHALTSQQLC